MGDQNVLIAGRNPSADDLVAVRKADAVILPQGCTPLWHELARNNCPHVFPNYDARFAYPGKIDQIRLFKSLKVPYPQTETFTSVDDFFRIYGKVFAKPKAGFPFVFKFNWGGEGNTVFHIRSFQEFRNIVQKAADYERGGQKGFMIQKYIPNGNRTLRIAIVGDKIVSYWKVVGTTEDFYANLARGATIDAQVKPRLKEKAVLALRRFCDITGINLAGFDFLFREDDSDETPLFLEINYFFGRQGFGGNERYYELLISEIDRWVAGVRECMKKTA